MRDHQPVTVESLLRHIPLFDGLSGEELARIGGNVREIRLDKGDNLFRVGDPCTGFHILVHGRIKLAFSSPNGSEKVVDLIKPGQSFGEAIMFLGKPYFIFAEALCESLVLHLPKSAIFDELKRDHDFVHKMLAGMAARLHQLMSDVESYSLQTGRQRTVSYLLNELLADGQQGDSAMLDLQAQKGIIASRLNVTQEHFSRILHDLAERGLIEVESRKIRIPSVTRLREFQLE